MALHPRRRVNWWLVVVCTVATGFIVADRLDIGATQKADALLSEGAEQPAPAEALPQRVRLTLDGVMATFTKGSPAYDQLVHLLGRVTIESSMGPYPAFSTRRPCGDLTIVYFAIPFRCQLYRSSVNPNFMWIRLRKLTSPGTTYPTIVDDGRLLRLVQQQETQQQGTESK